MNKSDSKSHDNFQKVVAAYEQLDTQDKSSQVRAKHKPQDNSDAWHYKTRFPESNNPYTYTSTSHTFNDFYSEPRRPKTEEQIKWEYGAHSETAATAKDFYSETKGQQSYNRDFKNTDSFQYEYKPKSYTYEENKERFRKLKKKQFEERRDLYDS